ncbi:uncharacterized protein METZ01_LOCUS321205, partial [marine metagenome]
MTIKKNPQKPLYRVWAGYDPKKSG